MPSKDSGFEWGVYRGEIESLCARGASTKDIWQSLFDRYNNIPSSYQTLKRKIKEWQGEDPSFAPRYSSFKDLLLSIILSHVKLLVFKYDSIDLQ
jgi:hypothetical protein